MKAHREYHHGDLRKALVDAAASLLEIRSATDLSLREVARQAGVSSGAPYHHYQTKADLLVDVACRGFEGLAAVVQPIDESDEPPQVRLQQRCEAYIVFGVEHAAHYRVMFSPELRTSTEHARYDAIARREFDGLQKAVGAVAPELTGQALFALSRTVWSAAHGFVFLLVEGTINALGPSQQRAAIRTTAIHLTAMVTAVSSKTTRRA
jgi:AcrR family transcriptional regulator